MKRYTKQFAAAVLLSATLMSAQCTQEESLNMMMALQPVGQKWAHEVTEMSSDDPEKVPLVTKVSKFHNEMTKVGLLSRDGKYPEACKGYENIASKYGIDLKELMKTSPTVASLKQSGSDGKCSLSDAAIKMMNLLTAAPELRRKEPEAINKIEMSLVSDPAGVCEDMDKLISKYSIQMEEPSL